MTLNELRQRIPSVTGSYGGLDFLTGETVIESATLEESANGGGGLSLSWKSDTPTCIPAGTVFNGYIMMSNYVPSFGSNGIYQHSPRFSEPAALLGKMLYYKQLAMYDSEGIAETQTLYTFTYYGPASELLASFSEFVSGQSSGGFSFNVSYSAPEAYIFVSFDGDTIKSAAQKIAEACDMEVYYSGTTINIGNSGIAIADEYYNRFIVFGGTKNMAKRTSRGYYSAVTKRLQGDTIDLSGSSPAMTKILVFDDIYPKLELFIDSVRYRECYLLDNEGNRISDGSGAGDSWKTYRKYYVTLKTKDNQPFALDTQLVIQEKTLGILFQEGSLSGREFEAAYYSSVGQLEKDDDDVGNGLTPAVGEFRIFEGAVGEYLLPSASFAPVQGQKVTLTNVKVPDELVAMAKAELDAAAEAVASMYASGGGVSYSAEHLWPDFLTGEPSSPSLGASGVGGSVTGITTDLITGAQTVTYGTTKPKGLLTSLIDKVDRVSTNGGHGTTASVSGEDDDYTRAKTSTEAFKQLQLAGGNIGYFNLTQKVAKAANLWSIDEVSAEIAYLLFGVESVKQQLANGVTVTIQMTPQEQLSVTIGGTSYSPTARLAELFAAYYAIRRGTHILTTPREEKPQSYQFTMYGSTIGSGYHQYDLCIRAYSLASPTKELIDEHEVRGVMEGGVEVFMYADGGWKIIREYVASLIANMSGKIYALAYGSSGDGGFIAKIGSFEAFANAFMRDGNGNIVGVSGSSLVLTSESGVLSTKFKWTDENNVEHDVTASIGTSVSYDETSGTYKGRLMLDGDNVAINGECISITNNGSPVAVFTDGKLTASLIDVTTLAVSVVNAINGGLTINADRIDFNGKTITLGTDASSVSINGGNVSVVSGKTLKFSSGSIDFTAGATISMNAGQLNFNGEQLTLGTRDSQLTIQGGDMSVAANGVLKVRSGVIDLRTAQVKMRADDIAFATSTFSIDASHITFVAGGSTLTLSTGIVSLLTSNLGTEGAKKELGGAVGMVMRHEGSSGSFTLGSYVYDQTQEDYVFESGLNFEKVNGISKLSLTSDNVIINANVFTANAANMVSAMVGETGVKVYKTNSGSAVRLGVFNNGSETAGISFDYTTSGSGSSARTKLTLNSDNVAISGDCITFSATSSFTATVQGMGAIMKGSTDGSGSFSVGYYANGSLVPVINFIRANNQTKLNLTANNCSISGDAIDLTGKEISISSLVDGSTAVFEGGKLKLDYIDAAQIVTDGLQAGAIDANDATIENLNAVNLTVTGDSTFEGTVNGKIIAQDMYHKVAIVSSGGNNEIYKADIVMIGGNFSGLNEDVVITLPDPTQCSGKVVTIYGAQKPSQFSSHVIKLSIHGQNQTEIRTAWGTTCIMINNSNNNLVYTNEMVLRSDGSHWLVYKWTCIEVTNTGTYVKDLLSGLA